MSACVRRHPILFQFTEFIRVLKNWIIIFPLFFQPIFPSVVEAGIGYFCNDGVVIQLKPIQVDEKLDQNKNLYIYDSTSLKEKTSNNKTPTIKFTSEAFIVNEGQFTIGDLLIGTKVSFNELYLVLTISADNRSMMIICSHRK